MNKLKNWTLYYIIDNYTEDVCYVGISTNPNHRRLKHLNLIERGEHQHIQHSNITFLYMSEYETFREARWAEWDSQELYKCNNVGWRLKPYPDSAVSKKQYIVQNVERKNNYDYKLNHVRRHVDKDKPSLMCSYCRDELGVDYGDMPEIRRIMKIYYNRTRWDMIQKGTWEGSIPRIQYFHFTKHNDILDDMYILEKRQRPKPKL